MKHVVAVNVFLLMCLGVGDVCHILTSDLTRPMGILVSIILVVMYFPQLVGVFDLVEKHWEE